MSIVPTFFFFLFELFIAQRDPKSKKGKMHAASLFLMGLAPTAVLGATYLATNNTLYVGTFDDFNSAAVVLFDNSTGPSTIAWASQVSLSKTALQRSNPPKNQLVTVTDGGGLYCDQYDGYPVSYGFSFDGDTLVYKNDSINHGFRGCNGTLDIWTATCLSWDPTSSPLKENCTYVSLTKIEA